MDAALVQVLRTDYTTASLNAQDRAMLDYVAQLTRDAAQIRRADLDRLRQVGFADWAILQINLLASLFNYFNRVADGLGVGRDR